LRDEKFLTIKHGDYVTLLNPIKEGYINLPVLSNGKIVSNSQKQYEASIWFYDMGFEYGENKIKEKLEISNLDVRGLVINLQKKDFAINYIYREHSKIQIDSRKLVDIPLFKENEHMEKIPSGWYIGNERGTEYFINEIIDVIENNFTQWVEQNTKTRKIFKYEKDDFPEGWDRVLTDESYVRFEEKKKELELKFAQVTGLYNEFRGGLLFE